MHQFILGTDQLECSLAEKNLGVLMDTKLNMSDVLMLQRKQMVTWAARDKALPAG